MKKIIFTICFLQVILLGASTAQSTPTIISGSIHTATDGVIKNAHVFITNSSQNFYTEVVATDGTFSIEVPDGGEYELYFTKEEAPLNGVSTFDMVLTSKHILNLTPYNTYYAILAMDTNGSQTVSVFDLVIDRLVILGVLNEFPTASWKFLEAMDDPTDFSTPPPVNTIPVTVEEGNQKTLDMVGVKTGDINDSAILN